MKISQDWNSFYQSISLYNQEAKAFRLEACVRAKVLSPLSKAAIWVRIDNKNGDRSFFDNMMDRPIQSDTWNVYIIEGTIHKNAAVLNFGGLCMNNGEFYFTNFVLHIENKHSILEKVTIQNPYVTGTTSQMSIPGWQQGTARQTPREIKEYTFQSEYSEELGVCCLKISGSGIFEVGNDYTPQIAVLIGMLQDLGKRMIRTVQELTAQEIDYIPNENLNSISVLITHIAATERYYQICTFEQRKFTEAEKQVWETALGMGEKAHKTYAGYPIAHYIDIYDNVRNKTLDLFKDKSDDWLQEISLHGNHHHHHWLHVLEHQSFHLGQMVLLKKMM